MIKIEYTTKLNVLATDFSSIFVSQIQTRGNLYSTTMVFFTNSLLFDIVLCLVSSAYLVYKLWTRKYKYWEKRGVVHLKPTFPLGTVDVNVLRHKIHLGAAGEDIYNNFKGERYVGTYTLREPKLFLRDPEIIKYIMTKDFNHFVNRGMFPVLKHDFISNHLFNMEGEPWRRMRVKLTPTFTSGKMRFMFNFIEVVSQQLSEYLMPLAENNSVIEIKDLIARFNIDIIASCAFGLEVNSLEDRNSKFREIGRGIFDLTKWQLFKMNFIMFFPKITEIFQIQVTKSETSNFILNLLKDTIEYRKKNSVVRNDFIDLLTKVKEKTLKTDKEDEDGANDRNHYKGSHHTDDEEFTLKEMAAQVFVFFAAGFETAASTTSFCLYELSKNKIIQDKLRTEVDTVLQKHGGKITYQGLQELHYMDKCINETLRLYASLPFLSRQCVKSYKMPDSDLMIEEGTKIVIPTYSIHHDPEYYPDPYKFDPERFTEEAINSRHHYTFLPFGEGPRVCIGKRLGIMQVKMAVITVLKDLEVSPAPGLPDQLNINPRLTITTSETPIELILSKRKL